MWSSGIGLLALLAGSFPSQTRGTSQVSVQWNFPHSLSYYSHGDAADFEELYHFLQKSILSHDSQLRLNALRLLVSPAIKVPGPDLEVVKRCLQSEEVSLDVQGVRERVLRMGRVGQIVTDGNRGADLCVRWLVGVCRRVYFDKGSWPIFSP